MLHVAFVGTFTASLEQPVRRHLTVPCEIVVASETDILPRLPKIDVLVTMGLTAEMGRAATRLKLLQVPGAGVDRVDRTAVPAGAVLANAYGHEVGIAECVIGAMLALTREFSRLDAALRRGDWQSRWAVGTPPPLWPELAGGTIGILGYGRIGQNIARRARAFDMQSGGTLANRWRTIWRCSEARTFSTGCWSAPITSSCRCRPVRRRSAGLASRSSAG
jgi:phosphoglycerate dehydrogenase-like enzyme